MTPYSPSKCAQLNTDPACSQPYWKDFKGFNDVQNFYVTWCIWNTQGLFLDLYNASALPPSLPATKLENSSVI